MNIVIPMSGLGSRFAQAGYADPKPFIKLPNGKTMIESVTENVTPNGSHKIYWLVRSEHIERASPIAERLGVTQIPVQNVTQGAACTVLLVTEFIDNDQPLLLANSDQLVDADINDFVDYTRNYDGGIVTFNATHPKWSYVRTSDDLVCEVAEKLPISANATAGIYAFNCGSDFVYGAKQMIRQDIRVNGEFYVAPIYNELILSGRKIVAWGIDSDRMHGLGTPADLEAYADRYRAQ